MGIPNVREAILETLGICSLATTKQLEIFFSDTLSPGKRASENLIELKKEKLVQGDPEYLTGRSKMWRLTKKARDQRNITRRPVSFRNSRIPHVLALTDCYLSIRMSGKLTYFQTEIRECYTDFKSGGEIKHFCPDAYFIYDGTSYFLEVQRMPIEQKRWRLKWDAYEEFFSAGYHRTLEWFKGETIPTILVITNQKESTVHSHPQINNKIRVIKDIQAFLRMPEMIDV